MIGAWIICVIWGCNGSEGDWKVNLTGDFIECGDWYEVVSGKLLWMPLNWDF